MQQAAKGNFEPFDAAGWRLGIVVAEFNRHITDKLCESAVKRAAAYGVMGEHMDIIRVAGSVEIPLALQYMAATGRYQALLGIGCVIRGDTPHFDYVCKFVTEGILRVQLDWKMPIGFGVLTCDTQEQALERVHLGGEHIDAVMHLARVIGSP
jgi:6,7-dimethyl-8-ribityllumazine synthase